MDAERGAAPIVIPAKAGISPPTVIPAQAGISPPIVIPAQAGISWRHAVTYSRWDPGLRRGGGLWGPS